MSACVSRQQNTPSCAAAAAAHVLPSCLRQYLYFCTSRASKLSTWQRA
jgi:hypothetical protein